MKAIDIIFANQIAHDGSLLVYANPLFSYTIAKAKSNGKIVVVMAGNSEPNREHMRIMEEYRIFDIKHKYIYGDPRYSERCKKSYSLADSIITISRFSCETYRSGGYDMEKFKLIPLTGTDFPLQSKDGDGTKKKAFISTAFHNFIKGTQRLLLAWKTANIQNVPLFIVGSVCEDLQEFINKNGPFDNVKFVGYLGSLTDFYKQYDAVGVLLSLSEGAVRTTPELMSFGFPMITSPDAACDIVENGKNGFVVNPTNEKEIVNCLSWFAEDWSRVHQFRTNVFASVSHRTARDFALECADYIMSLLPKRESSEHV